LLPASGLLKQGKLVGVRGMLAALLVDFEPMGPHVFAHVANAAFQANIAANGGIHQRPNNGVAVEHFKTIIEATGVNVG
jgi:hypothetical protein